MFRIPFSNILFYFRTPLGADRTDRSRPLQDSERDFHWLFDVFIKITLPTRFPGESRSGPWVVKKRQFTRCTIFYVRFFSGAGEGDWCFRLDGGSQSEKNVCRACAEYEVNRCGYVPVVRPVFQRRMRLKTRSSAKSFLPNEIRAGKSSARERAKGTLWLNGYFHENNG